MNLPDVLIDLPVMTNKERCEETLVLEWQRRVLSARRCIGSLLKG